MIEQFIIDRVKPFITEVKSEYNETAQCYVAHCVLKDNAVATGTDTNPHIAVKRAVDVVFDYAAQKGWIKPLEQLFTFSTALTLLKTGARITRKGWNGADQWLSISCPESKEVAADNFWSPHNADFARKNGGTATVAPCITLKNAQNQIIMGWIPSAGDLFAEDWLVLPND
ncbi:Thoeris anti-defense Tad2 family protein [Acinetobacter sp. NS4_7]